MNCLRNRKSHPHQADELKTKFSLERFGKYKMVWTFYPEKIAQTSALTSNASGREFSSPTGAHEIFSKEAR